MGIGNIRLHPKKLFLCLGLMSGILGVVSADTAFSQTPSGTVLEVVANRGTYFKQRDYWYQQSPSVPAAQRCYARDGERLTFSSIRDGRDSGYRPSSVANNNPRSIYFQNIEYISDYWEVTFEPNFRCSGQTEAGRTWFVYKQHVQVIR